MVIMITDFLVDRKNLYKSLLKLKFISMFQYHQGRGVNETFTVLS